MRLSNLLRGHRTRRVGLAVLAGALVLVACQSGTPDPSANGGERGPTTVSFVTISGGPNGEVTGLTGAGTVVRLRADGTPDPTWGTGGTATLPAFPCDTVCYTPDPTRAPQLTRLIDDSFIVVRNGVNGMFLDDDRSAAFATHLRPNGTIDTGYGSNGTLTIVGDSGIFDPTAFPSYHLLQSGAILRIRWSSNSATEISAWGADGSAITTFTVPALLGNASRFVGLDGNGEVVVASGQSAWRINNDRTLDLNFGTDGVGSIAASLDAGQNPTWTAGGTALTLAGMAVEQRGTVALLFQGQDRAVIGELNQVGQHLTTFGADGLVTSRWPDSSLAPVEQLALRGDQVTTRNSQGLMRINADGSSDLTFGNGGVGLRDQLHAIDAHPPSGTTSLSSLSLMDLNDNGIAVYGATYIGGSPYSAGPGSTAWIWRLRL